MDQPEAVEVPKPPPEKKGGGKVLLLIVTVVLVAGAGVAGAVLGPKVLHAQGAGEPAEPAAAEDGAEPAGGDHQQQAGAEPAAEEAPNGAPGTTAQFGGIVVDIRNREGELHHLKVGLSFELNEKFTEDEFKRWTPRGRQAALTFLRALDYETATDPKRFEAIRKELCDKVKTSMGKNHVRRVLITDFVAQ